MDKHPLIAPLVVAALLMIVWATVIGLTRFGFVGARKWTYKDIKPGEPHGPQWYASLNRVLINSTESFALFAPAALLHMWLGSSQPWLATLGWVYVGARLVYAAVYLAMGYQILCSIVWLVAFAVPLVLWVLPLLG